MRRTIAQKSAFTPWKVLLVWNKSSNGQSQSSGQSLLTEKGTVLVLWMSGMSAMNEWEFPSYMIIPLNKGFYYNHLCPLSMLTVSPLHMKFQVASFQKMQTCVPMSNHISWFTCVVYIIMCMHPLQTFVLLCTLLYTILYWIQ